MAGTRETLKQMRELVRKYKTHPLVFLLARKLIEGLPQKAFTEEAKAIHKFVRDEIRYVKDVHGVETLQSPDKTLQLRAGDCDDKSTLTASLLQSIGHPVRFVVVGNEPGRFSHVFVETKIRNKWYPVETTEPWKFGEVKRKAKYRGVYFV